MSETSENDSINNLFVNKNTNNTIEITELGRELGVSFIPDLNNSDIYPNLWHRRLRRMMPIMPSDFNEIDTTSPEFITILEATIERNKIILNKFLKDNKDLDKGNS